MLQLDDLPIISKGVEYFVYNNQENGVEIELNFGESHHNVIAIELDNVDAIELAQRILDATTTKTQPYVGIGGT